MPTYSYRCKNCGEFDYHQSIRDSSLAYCPQCMSPVTKLFPAAGIQFKGSGFYSTDSKGN